MKEKMMYSIVSGHQERTKESPLIQQTNLTRLAVQGCNRPVSTSRGTPAAETVVSTAQL